MERVYLLLVALNVAMLFSVGIVISQKFKKDKEIAISAMAFTLLEEMRELDNVIDFFKKQIDCKLFFVRSLPNALCWDRYKLELSTYLSEDDYLTISRFYEDVKQLEELRKTVHQLTLDGPLDKDIEFKNKEDERRFEIANLSFHNKIKNISMISNSMAYSHISELSSREKPLKIAYRRR